MNQLGQSPSGSCYVSDGNRQAPSHPDRGALGFFPRVLAMARGEIVRPRANMKAEIQGSEARTRHSGANRQGSARKAISCALLGETENRPPMAEGCLFTGSPDQNTSYPSPSSRA